MGRIGQILAGWGKGRLVAVAAVIALLAGVGIGLAVTSGGSSSGHHQNAGGTVGVGNGGSGGNLLTPSSTSTTVPGQPGPTTTSTTSTTVKGQAATTTTTVKKATTVGGGPTGSNSSTSVPGQTTTPTTAPGLTWHQQAIPANTSALQAVDCVNASDCWAGGYGGMMSTANGGATWGAESGFPALASGDHVSGVACPTTTDCWATTIEGQVLSTTSGGSSWSSVRSAAAYFNQGSIYAITCTDTSHCWIVGETASSSWQVAQTADGQVWTTQTLCTSATCRDLWAISCPTTTKCTVGGLYVPTGSNTTYQAVWTTTDGGATWSPRPQELSGGTSSNVTGLSCVDTNHCVMTTGSSIVSTSDGGNSWQTAPGTGGASSVSCVFSGTCWASGYNDSAVLYQPSWGAGWSTQYSAPSGIFSAISCLTSGQCWAVQGWAGDAPSAGARSGAVYARAAT